MAKDIDVLRSLASQIKNEVEDGKNTASRIGGMFVDVVDKMESTRTEAKNDALNVVNPKIEQVEGEVDDLALEVSKLKWVDCADNGVYLCGADGKALIRLDVLDTKGGLGENLKTEILKLIPENKNALVDTIEDGFYICNENGRVIGYYKDGAWNFGTDADCPKFVSSLAGSDGAKIKKNLAANERVTITNYPMHDKKGTQIVFGGKITSAFSSIKVGRLNTDKSNLYRSAFVEIDATKLKIYFYQNSSTSYYYAEVAHNLTISTMLNVNLQFLQSGKMKATIQTLSGSFTYTTDKCNLVTDGVIGAEKNFDTYDANGYVFAETIGTAMTDCILSAHNIDFSCPIWLFGDSYFGVNSSRWIGKIKELGYFNYYINGLAGRTSTAAYNDLVRALNYGTPKYLVFALITNDTNNVETFKSNINNVISLCASKGVEPIFTTQANLTSKSGMKTLSDYVVATGKRYLDFGHAVSANGWDIDATWYDGFLSSDNVHPTSNGAIALAMQALKDMPELMQYGGSGSAASEYHGGDE